MTSICLVAIALTVSACAASFAARPPCDLGSRPTTPPPDWITKTAFEMRLADNYYYGKGASSLRANYGERRVEAQKQSYGDLAQQVSVKIFTRQVIKQTTEETRAEAVTKAISDVNARGIETIREWQDNQSCTLHVMVRVSQKIASTWKGPAESYLTHRVGIGMVRRTDEAVYALRYREIGQPPVFIEIETNAALQKFIGLGAAALFENALRQSLKKYSVKVIRKKDQADFVMMIAVHAGGEANQFVAEARLLNRKTQNRAASASESADYDQARANPEQKFIARRGGGYEPEQSSPPTKGAYLKKIASQLAASLLKDWLEN